MSPEPSRSRPCGWPLAVANRAEHAYAVVRLDLYHEPLMADAIRAEPDIFVTVREVVPTLEEAKQEAARLNDVNADKGAFYFWQGTRFFPDGRRVQRGY